MTDLMVRSATGRRRPRTVREFARRWIVTQTRWKRADYEHIRILFADEPAGSIAPLSG